MIAVTVLALLTTTISLSVNRPRGAAASDPARFGALHAVLREQAILSRQVLGLRLDGAGYQRLRRADGRWQEDGTPVQWRGEVQVQQPFSGAGPVQFVPSGQATPLRIRFEAGGRVTVCEADAWAGLSCRAG